MKNKKVVLVTGSAGFIGYHASKMLMSKNNKVIGIDNINSYYDVSIKDSMVIYNSIKPDITDIFLID